MTNAWGKENTNLSSRKMKEKKVIIHRHKSTNLPILSVKRQTPATKLFPFLYGASRFGIQQLDIMTQQQYSGVRTASIMLYEAYNPIGKREKLT